MSLMGQAQNRDGQWKRAGRKGFPTSERRITVAAAACALTGLALLSCGGGSDDDPADRASDQSQWIPDDPAPPTARMAQVEEFRQDLAAARHASDGAGQAVLVLAEGEQASVVAGYPSRWTIRYTVGPLGLAEGAGLYFMPEPFWGWSPPQNIEPRAAGYTRVETAAQGAELEVQSLGQMLLVTIAGRGLVEGEEILITYGAGERGAQADMYAERGARLWLSVDGDGDGVRQILASSPTIDVLPGPAQRVVLHATSVLRPGETGRLTVALVDGIANRVPDAAGEVRLSYEPGGAEWQALTIAPGDGGCATRDFSMAEPGVYRLRAEVELDGLPVEAWSNPVWVDPDAPRTFWGDLHGHSNYSDGTGLPEDYFTYARDVAGLDVSALTDHDHFGVLFLDQNLHLWDDIQAQTKAFHDPGRFVTLLGLEWTSWIHGHRHILYFSDEGEVLSSVDPEVETPRQLWQALEGRDALTFAHHSAGDPVPTNWTFAPDPAFEPVTEVMSVHGSSEAADSPVRVRGAVPGNFVRDVLDRGYRLGFIGSGDGHDGHPGLPHLSPTYGYRRIRGGGEQLGNGGLAGMQASELTREGVLEALRARRVFATSGPRILMDVSLDSHPLGSSVPAGELPPVAELQVSVIGTAPIASLDVIRSGELATRYELDTDRRELFTRIELEGLEGGEYVYLRITQSDGGLAWSSPFFID